MKILIADDQTRRYERLIPKLQELGIERKNIELVSCANDADEKLNTKHYDLLILDILLPLWPEQAPDTNQYSLDLLFQLQEGEDIKRPGRVIGITGDIEATGEARSTFEDAVWNIIEYSDSNDTWITQIINCVKYIQSDTSRGNSSQTTSRVDLAIVCALEKPELEEVLKLPWNWSDAKPLDDMTFIYEGYFHKGSRRYSVAATFAPRMGMVSTALRSAALISHLKPRIIAMCGICAGVRGKVEMGDVLFADPAWDFQSGKRVKDLENTSFSIAPHQLPANSLIRTHVEQLRSDRTSLLNISSQFQDAPRIPNIKVGPVASGSAVLADGEVINTIKEQQRDLIGVEMEVYGLYSAAMAASRPQPRVFALKSVCDFADPDKADGVQQYAAFTSARVLQLLMDKYADRLFE